MAKLHWRSLVLILFTAGCHSFPLCTTESRRGRRTAFQRAIPSLSHAHHLRPTTIWLSEPSAEIDTSDNNKKAKEKKKSNKQREYERRKQEWLDRYGSLEALQTTFGSSNETLSPEQTRRLYHALLPRSLLALYEFKVMLPEELAPLAYEARMAAKQYARSRSDEQTRKEVEQFDQQRIQERQSNNNTDLSKTNGNLSWDEIWSKYEAQIVQEECEKLLNKYKKKSPEMAQQKTEKKLKKLRNNKDLTMSIYLRILQRSCVTNQAFDDMFLKSSDDDDDVLNQIAAQLDQDVQDILLRPKDRERAEKRQRKAQRKHLQQLEKQEQQRLKEEQKQAKRLERYLVDEANDAIDEFSTLLKNDKNATMDDNFKNTTDREVLKIMAGTRRKFREMDAKDETTEVS